MPIPQENRLHFFVFVIESPSAADLYNRRSEGNIIRQAVELNGITCVVKTAISLQAFDACLKIGLAEAMASLPGFIPILHISAHGSDEGIQLSDRTIILWHELRDHFRPVNESFKNSLIVCMSSCKGYSGVRMTMHPKDQHLPFFALVGCSDEPTWAETAVAYATLYHQLHRGEHISVAVEAMRVASGRATFWLKHAEASQQGYIEYVKARVTPQDAQASLEQRLAEEPQENQANLKLMK